MINVQCQGDLTFDCWLQRRTGKDVSFYKTWDEYKEGFGTPPGDFWLGNEAMYNLTSKDDYELRIEMQVNGNELYAQYTSFQVAEESDGYRLRLGSHSGTLEEMSSGLGFSYHNDQKFSTKDVDNDHWYFGNSAVTGQGGWWYNSGSWANLNDRWGDLRWFTGSEDFYPDATEMKIRRI
ncbi:angiopoietin-related protein 1 [Elysia marginata]|uniref:Angiopoietin-related protein 1 n=1 Tax=Elysia marginata TaxID=1093978 RepID=A0AAV4I7U7_9GAST|nr:angiopoietin-related protein 1 [Elysia marginata]